MSDLCPVAVAHDSTEDENQPETAAESHLLLFKQKKYCDVTFTFSNLPNRIQAHEIHLKARSPVFAKIFRMRKSGNVQGNEIEISESTPEIFQLFLEFIYADKFEEHITQALDLLHLAQKYKVNPLIKKCEQLLLTEILIEDSVKIFETARRYGRRELMDRAGQIMVKSFLKLARSDALANAEEETLIYLLERDDLDVKEVGLFQFILDWGRKKIGGSADNEVLRNKLKNVISKIRYTNMAVDEFTMVVVPTGLLSEAESLSVFSFLCGDDMRRRDLNLKFNTNHRKVETTAAVIKSTVFYVDQQVTLLDFPAFSKQCISFKAGRTQVDGKVLHFLKKNVITAIKFQWPVIVSQYKEKNVLDLNVLIGEYFGPVNQGNFIIRFQKKLPNCQPGYEFTVSVEPPVELMSGRTCSVIVEDNSTSGYFDTFRNHPKVYFGCLVFRKNREPNINLEDVSLTLTEIQSKTDYYDQKLPYWSADLAVIRGIEIGLM